MSPVPPAASHHTGRTFSLKAGRSLRYDQHAFGLRTCAEGATGAASTVLWPKTTKQVDAWVQVMWSVGTACDSSWQKKCSSKSVGSKSNFTRPHSRESFGYCYGSLVPAAGPARQARLDTSNRAASFCSILDSVACG